MSMVFQKEDAWECELCGYEYKEKKWAEKCEAWCAAYHSCNLDIVAHGTPPSDYLS